MKRLFQKRGILAALVLAFCCASLSLHAQTGSLPAGLEGLDKDEIQTLKSGKVLIREVQNTSRLALSATTEESKEIRTAIARLNPNYLTEVISLEPFRPESRQMERLAATLSDIKGYIGIPYWSERMQKTYDLFDMVELLVSKPQPGGLYVEAEQHMKPFDNYKASYEYSLSKDRLLFRSANLTPLSYKGIRSVSPGNMKWYLYVFQSGGVLVYYGVGAVKAFDMLGVIRDRLEVSFVGRIGAFFNHMSSRLK